MEKKQNTEELIKKIKNIITGSVVIFIRIYQKSISPLFGDHCRFTPTCSEYFIKSLQKNGLITGTVTGLYRIVRCNPFNPGGLDPVKEK